MNAFELLLEDLNTSNDWVMQFNGAQTLINSRNNIQIWMDNIPFFDTNIFKPHKLSLNLYQKYKLYKACQKAMSNNISHIIKK